MLAAQYAMVEQLDAAYKTNLMHSQIRVVTGRKRGNNPTTFIEDKEVISSWRKRRHYLGGTNILVSSIMTTEVIWQKSLRR